MKRLVVRRVDVTGFLPQVAMGSVLAIAVYFASERYFMGEALAANKVWFHTPLWIPIGGLGIGTLVSIVVAWSGEYRRVHAGKIHGLLAVDLAVELLEQCDPESFTDEETRARRKVIKHIDKLAATIESIPVVLRIADPELTHLARERAAAMSTLRLRVATMSNAEHQQAIQEAILHAGVLHDSGRWLELPAVEIVDPPRPSVGYRLGWALIAGTSFAGIVAVLILTAMSKLPASAVPITFVLGLVLYPALSHLGISGDTMKQAVEVVSKSQSGLTGKPEASKTDGAKPDAR